MAQLNGPTSFSLGNPKVTSLSPDNAIVESCVSDSGTTTPSGLPGPVLLDGNQNGFTGAEVSDQMQLVGGHWLISGGTAKGVKTC